MRFSFLVSGLLFLLLGSNSQADERILDFRSTVEVQQDSTIVVTEEITVRAEGKSIRRGIYRDLPIARGGPDDYHTTTFEVVDVLRNGESEAWHSESDADSVRIYIGQAERMIPHGVHTYTLVYRGQRQLRYFDSHDELYWNVTGNDWVFPIDGVSATVRLPEGIPSDRLKLHAYTGPRGAQGEDWTGRIDGNGDVVFAATRPLAVGEGLTVAVGWPKGHVQKPESFSPFLGFVIGNFWGVFLIGLLTILVWYLFAWFMVGRDPKGGVVIPRYEPPQGFSPASLRFVRRMGYDYKTFTTALVNLAVKGHLVIEQDGDNISLSRTGNTGEALAAGESVILDKLLGKNQSVELDNSNQHKVLSAFIGHSKSLAKDYHKRYFATNGYWLLAGWAFILLPGTLILIMLPDGWGFLFGLLVLLPLLLLLIVVNAVFYKLMKAPTRAGRKLLDEIEGFKLYLEVAEADELALKSPPEKTPKLFERYLPYAIALDIEGRWAARFQDVLAAAMTAGATDYHPTWYRGSEWDSESPVRFAENMGSEFTSALFTSSTMSTSSDSDFDDSGSSGDGSSGGGGGGGGGGGW